jgi:hypothetical protein
VRDCADDGEPRRTNVVVVGVDSRHRNDGADDAGQRPRFDDGDDAWSRPRSICVEVPTSDDGHEISSGAAYVARDCRLA